MRRGTGFTPVEQGPGITFAPRCNAGISCMVLYARFSYHNAESGDGFGVVDAPCHISLLVQKPLNDWRRAHTYQSLVSKIQCEHISRLETAG